MPHPWRSFKSATAAKEARLRRIDSTLEKPLACWPIFGYCSCPFFMTRPISPTFAALCGAAFALTITGCKKPEIHVYTVNREKPAPPVTAAPRAPELTDAAAAPASERPRPKLDYQVPAGWKYMGPSQF